MKSSDRLNEATLLASDRRIANKSCDSKDIHEQIYKQSSNPDLEWGFIDGGIVRAHQHSAGAVDKENQAIGKSVGGNTTKIHMAVDAYGLPIQFDFTGGEVHYSKTAPELIVRTPLGVRLNFNSLYISYVKIR
jgi:hypothetical protein